MMTFDLSLYGIDLHKSYMYVEQTRGITSESM